jgi:hypothetical protein
MLISKQFSLANKTQNEKTGLWVFDPVNDNPVYTFSLVWNRTRRYYELTKTQIDAIKEVTSRAIATRSRIATVMPTGLTGSNLTGWTFDYRNFEGGTASTISFSNGLTGDEIVNSPEQGNLLKFRKEGYTFTIYVEGLAIPSDGYPRAISWTDAETTPRIYTASGLEFKPSETLKIGPNTIFEADIRAIGFDGREPSQVTYYY